MRYIVAVILAGAIIAGGAWFVRHTERSLKERVREAIKQGQVSGQLPPDIDAEEIDSADFGMEMPAAEQLRLMIAYALYAWRWVLVPAVLLSSLGIASLLGRLRR
jgi:hypothetical protein